MHDREELQLGPAGASPPSVLLRPLGRRGIVGHVDVPMLFDPHCYVLGETAETAKIGGKHDG